MRWCSVTPVSCDAVYRLNLSEALVEAYVPENEYTMTAMVGNESVSFTDPEIHCSGAELEMLFFGKTDTGECSYDDASRACHGGFMEVKDVKAAIQCPAGFFCPDGFTCAIACAYGGTCTPSVPKANSTNKCEYAHRYEDEPAKQNDAGVCPGARYLSLCEAGYFCPNATTPGIACPVGHYCPPATQHARPCPSILYASRHLCPDEKMASPNTQRLAALLVLTSGLGLILTSRVWDALRNQLHTRMLVRMVSKVIRASEGDSIPVTLTNSELRTFSPKDNAELEKSANVLRAWQARVTRTTPRWIYDPTEDGLSASGDRGAYISSIFDADANLGTLGRKDLAEIE